MDLMYIGPDGRIYIDPDKVDQMMDQARERREQAEALLATVKADKMGQLDAYYIHRAVHAPRDGNVIDITEHLRKRHESH